MSARLFLGPREIKQLSESEPVAALRAVFCDDQFLTFNRLGHGGALSFFWRGIFMAAAVFKIHL